MEGNTVQMIVAGTIFAAAYALIIWDKFDRTVIALLGAALMVFTRILSQDNAFAEIDFNTIALLVSMMIIVMITRRTGVFEYLALKVVKASKCNPSMVLLLLALITGVLSAFLDNVTTILLILPVTLSVAKDLRVDPFPLILSEVFASNVGGTATLIGDPPNIMIGSATGYHFIDFIVNDGVIILPLLVLTSALFMLMYRKRLSASAESRLAVMSMNEKELIKDKKLLVKCMIVLGLVIVGFVLQSILHLASSTIAIAGAVLLLIISGIKTMKVLRDVEWNTVLFFAGLFIMVGGLKSAGIITMAAQGVLNLTQGNLLLTTMAILWLSAIASAFIDNIPFVATMIPLILDMGKISGMDTAPLWWALSLGACLGGNGTIIGASANVIASGMAEDLGHKIGFRKYFKAAFPMMLLTIVICTAYLYLAFFLKV
jgi:Na+/H+ antiporter NhaD/arsenite permease-like protein